MISCERIVSGRQSVFFTKDGEWNNKHKEYFGTIGRRNGRRDIYILRKYMYVHTTSHTSTYTHTGVNAYARAPVDAASGLHPNKPLEQTLRNSKQLPDKLLRKRLLLETKHALKPSLYSYLVRKKTKTRRVPVACDRKAKISRVALGPLADKQQQKQIQSSTLDCIGLPCVSYLLRRLQKTQEEVRGNRNLRRQIAR